MKGLQVGGLEERFAVRQVEIVKPVAGPGEILVRVRATGLMRSELGWYPTSHQKSGEPRLLAVPGHEFSGVVEAIGGGTAGFALGDSVYGMNDWFAEGGMAEYCVAPPESLARKPDSLTYEEAASVPIGALTAWQGWFERANLKAGERVLVHGGAGAVGVFAVQLAHLHGAHVTATAGTKHLEVVRRLGADVVIDYSAERFEDVTPGVDVVFDTVGGETRERSSKVLKKDGRMISIAADGEVTTDPKVRDAYFIVEARQPQLMEVAKLIDAGQLKTFVDAVVPLAEAGAAYAGDVVRRLGYGKVVVQVWDGV